MLWYLGKNKNKMKTFKEILSEISKINAIFIISILEVIGHIFFILIGSKMAVYNLIYWSIWLITISIFRYLNRKNKINNN